MICQRSVPVVYNIISISWTKGVRHTPSPGVSIPAVTTRFDKTKQDIRKGRKTGCPVSVGKIPSESEAY